MLREIISITGKPGLFKIVSHGNRRLIVEDLASKRRFPAMERDKIISLGDIAMYTESEDKPLGEILDSLYGVAEGKPVDIKKLASDGGLRDLFRKVLPDFDEERVHDSDIKKLLTWYNLLVEAGFTKFTEEEEKADEKADEKAEEKA